jgi:hypothetical protein
MEPTKESTTGKVAMNFTRVYFAILIVCAVGILVAMANFKNFHQVGIFVGGLILLTLLGYPVSLITKKFSIKTPEKTKVLFINIFLIIMSLAMLGGLLVGIYSRFSK